MTKKAEPSNSTIADILDQIANLLEAKEANRFRIQAYRQAASTLRQVDDSAAHLVQEGEHAALEDLPNIGEGIAGVIQEIVETGRSSQLDQLKSEVEPTAVLSQVPGIGEELAARVVEELGVRNLADLEEAAHDGRLYQVEGFGEGRVESVKVSLAGMLSPAARRRARQATDPREISPTKPPVEILLAIDQRYRNKAEAGELRKIAPKRFNPKGKAWLPIMELERADWRFTALFSNTKRAHELDKTDDWVVIYYEQDGEEDQCTVVTETGGPLEGLRVIRGREVECREYYAEEKGG